MFDSGYREFKDDIIEEDDKKSINDVVDSLSTMSVMVLVEYTHQQLPWRNAYEKGMNNVISNESIKECFKQYEK